MNEIVLIKFPDSSSCMSRHREKPFLTIDFSYFFNYTLNYEKANFVHFRKEVMIMRIEKLNSRQIRCVLTKEDLMQRELRISELAYGTDKAKELFHDMMEEASELGFEAEDIPLMIEAIPVSAEALELIVTKVEDPDELDTRFSKFTEFDELEYEDDEDEDEEAFHFVSEDPEGAAQDVASIEETLSGKLPQKKEEKAPVAQVFLFHDPEALIRASEHAALAEYVSSSLYQDEEQYYLLIEQKETYSEEFQKVCNAVLEYGKRYRMNPLQLASFKEHKSLILKKDALLKLQDC